MNAITWQRQEKFYEVRLKAITCFEEALKLNPSDEIAMKNLEVVRVLNDRPHYGRPHEYLKPVSDKPTFIFNAIMLGLERNRTGASLDWGMGYNTSSPVFDRKGNYKGESDAGFVPTVTQRDEVRIPNEEAIKDLLTLRMRWSEQELSKKSENSTQTPALAVSQRR
jgi:hypothetical protein